MLFRSRWREKDGDGAIDAAAELPGGRKFSTPGELKAILRAEPEVFTRALTEKMLTYALGRGLEPSDMPVVRKIVARAAHDQYRFATILSGIVESAPFQMRTRLEGSAPVNTVASTRAQ